MTLKITTDNKTRFATDDVVRLLRGALRATKNGRSTRYVLVAVGYTRKATSWSSVRWKPCEGGKRDLLISFSLLNQDHAPPELHALAGLVMEALTTAPGKVPSIPSWQRDTRWADDCTLKVCVPVTRTPQQRAFDREAHARRMLARAQADVERAQRRVDNWLPKVRYYDRKKEA